MHYSSLQRLYKDDKEALRKIFVEFASSSKKPQKYHVDKSVFNQTFRLNGVVGDRMFAMWDLNHNNKLNYQEFIHGLSDFLSASVEDKITMLFSIMDPEHQKVITHQEFTQLMTCLSKSAEASVTFLLTGLGEGNDSAEVDEKTLEGAIKELDAQSTGSISLASFIKWVVKQGALKCFVEKEWMVRQAMAPADAAKLVTEHFYDLIDKMIIPKLPMDSEIVRAALQVSVFPCLFLRYVQRVATWECWTVFVSLPQSYFCVTCSDEQCCRISRQWCVVVL